VKSFTGVSSVHAYLDICGIFAYGTSKLINGPKRVPCYCRPQMLLYTTDVIVDHRCYCRPQMLL